MAFKFYIVDPDQGEVFGTDSTGVAKKAAMDENLFVVDAEEDLFMITPEGSVEITDIEDAEGEDDNDELYSVGRKCSPDSSDEYETTSPRF